MPRNDWPLPPWGVESCPHGHADTHPPWGQRAEAGVPAKDNQTSPGWTAPGERKPDERNLPAEPSRHLSPREAGPADRRRLGAGAHRLGRAPHPCLLRAGRTGRAGSGRSAAPALRAVVLPPAARPGRDRGGAHPGQEARRLRTPGHRCGAHLPGHPGSVPSDDRHRLPARECRAGQGEGRCGRVADGLSSSSPHRVLGGLRGAGGGHLGGDSDPDPDHRPPAGHGGGRDRRRHPALDHSDGGQASPAAEGAEGGRTPAGAADLAASRVAGQPGPQIDGASLQAPRQATTGTPAAQGARPPARPRVHQAGPGAVEAGWR